MPFIFIASVSPQEKPSITILEIEPDEYIKGRVAGIDPKEYTNHKVIVYVRTDKWYIYPYERGGPGLSYAKIKQDGTWIIATANLEFPAD